jgi:murein DD-endopeptidase MepM/ murein hydrolase activator NlpD
MKAKDKPAAKTATKPAKPTQSQSTQAKTTSSYVAPPKPRGGPGAKLDPIIKVPVAGGRVSQQFGNVPKNRFINYESGTNLGTDIAGAQGSAIGSIAGGKIIAINPNAGAWGNQIIVDAGNGRQLAYNHMDDFGDFKVGQDIKAGDVLGTVGRTGQTTGAHLDLEATVNGASVPLSKAFPGARFDKSWGGAEKGVAGAKAYNRAQNAFYDTSDLTKSVGSVYASGSGSGYSGGSGSSSSPTNSVNASSKPSGGFSGGQFVNLASIASTLSPTRGMRRVSSLLGKSSTAPSSPSMTGPKLGSSSKSPIGQIK